MKQIKLSDHTADQVNQAQRLRLEAHAANLRAYQQALADRSARVNKARTSMRQAWRERRVLAALGRALQLVGYALLIGPTEPGLPASGRQERVWAVGNDGKRRVAEFLSRQLDDSWTLVSGYRNAKGEIDQVLVGPRGLFALKVKHVNGTVTVTGDTWRANKYDNYGNLMERARPITDRAGRSPSRQLNEPTERLLQLVNKSLPKVKAARIVVLSHDKSDVAQVVQPTVMPLTLASGRLASVIAAHPATLSPSDQRRLIDLLQRDHAHNLQRRQPAARPAGRVVGRRTEARTMIAATVTGLAQPSISAAPQKPPCTTRFSAELRAA